MFSCLQKFPFQNRSEFFFDSCWFSSVWISYLISVKWNQYYLIMFQVCIALNLACSREDKILFHPSTFIWMEITKDLNWNCAVHIFPWWPLLRELEEWSLRRLHPSWKSCLRYAVCVFKTLTPLMEIMSKSLCERDWNIPMKHFPLTFVAKRKTDPNARLINNQPID